MRRGEGGEGPLLAAVDYAQGLARFVWRIVLIFHISLYNEQHVFVFKMYLKSMCYLKNENYLLDNIWFPIDSCADF